MMRRSMKIFKKAVFVLFFASPLFSEPGQRPEVEVIDRLIEKTKDLLETQQNLRQKLLVFHETRDLFTSADESRVYAAQMVNAASLLLGLIVENHMQYLFSKEYLEELEFFSSFTKKNNLKRP